MAVPPLSLIFSALFVSLCLKLFLGSARDKLLLLFITVQDHLHNQLLYQQESFKSELNKITNPVEVHNIYKRARLL